MPDEEKKADEEKKVLKFRVTGRAVAEAEAEGDMPVRWQVTLLVDTQSANPDEDCIEVGAALVDARPLRYNAVVQGVGRKDPAALAAHIGPEAAQAIGGKATMVFMLALPPKPKPEATPAAGGTTATTTGAPPAPPPTGS